VVADVHNLEKGCTKVYYFLHHAHGDVGNHANGVGLRIFVRAIRTSYRYVILEQVRP